MSQDQVIYHRTFLPDGPYEHCTNCHDTRSGFPGRTKLDDPGLIRKPAPLRPLNGGDDFRSVDLAQRRKPYVRSQKRRAAYMLANGKLSPTYIVEKLDQQFGMFATLWEVEFSSLTGGKGTYTPVVDHTYAVIGHIGTVSTNRMAVAKQDFGESGLRDGDLEQFLYRDEPIYVVSQMPAGWTAFDPRAPFVIFTVAVSPDGEVVAGEQTGQNAGAIAVPGPFEYLTGMALVARLGAALVRGLLKVLVRKVLQSTAVKEIAGPTRKVLERVLARRAALKVARMPANSYRTITGMTRTHHEVFIKASEHTKLIIVVRHTNPKSIPLIDKGCPGKPKNLEFINTSPQSGIVMANAPDEVLRAQRLGYYVVGDGRKAKRFVKKNNQETAEEMPLNGTFWQVEKGQVIDPVTKKPIVGDYDLMGVIDPKAPGRNIGLIAKNGESLTDVTNPLVQRAAAAVNGQMTIPRVLHGPQDMYKGFRKGASAYLPDGTVRHFDTEDGVRAFYEALKRQPRAGAYPRPSPATPVGDELAERRARQRR
jgi:hypothetical protein